MMKFASRTLLSLTAAAWAWTASSASAVLLYEDYNWAQNGLVYNQSEGFGFGPFDGNGFWGAEVGGPTGNASNPTLVLIGNDAVSDGGCGFSVHLQYPEAFADHGPLVDGNILRVSAWIRIDPEAPATNLGFAFALLKIEFWNGGLEFDGSACGLACRTYDSEINGGFFTPYPAGLNTTDWTQIVFEYTVDEAAIQPGTLEEVRPVLVQGDFSGSAFDGNILVDDVRVEVFTDATEAAANPVNTNPPVGFVVESVRVVSQTFGSANGLSFDSQRGFRYQLEYSENGGVDYVPSGNPVVGDGTRMALLDEPTDTPRQYRITVLDLPTDP